MLKKSRIAMLVAGAMFAAQAGAISNLESPDVAWADEFASAEQITVFNPDGSSYSIIPGFEVAQLDPLWLTVGAESMPEHVTVFEPGGWVYTVEFTPLLTMWEPVDVIVMDDDVSVAPLAFIEENSVSRPTYVARYVSPPTYTGLLEESS